MQEPRLIPLKTMTSDIVKVSNTFYSPVRESVKRQKHQHQSQVEVYPVTDYKTIMSLCLTDAAVCRRESPENVGAHHAVRREDLVLIQTATMLNLEQSTWGSWWRPVQPRRNKRGFFMDHRERNMEIYFLGVFGPMHRTLSSPFTKNPIWSKLFIVCLWSRLMHFNAHEYSCYLLPWIVLYNFAAFKREFISPTVVHY